MLCFYLIICVFAPDFAVQQVQYVQSAQSGKLCAQQHISDNNAQQSFNDMQRKVKQSKNAFIRKINDISIWRQRIDLAGNANAWHRQMHVKQQIKSKRSLQNKTRMFEENMSEISARQVELQERYEAKNKDIEAKHKVIQRLIQILYEDGQECIERIANMTNELIGMNTKLHVIVTKQIRLARDKADEANRIEDINAQVDKYEAAIEKETAEVKELDRKIQNTSDITNIFELYNIVREYNYAQISQEDMTITNLQSLVKRLHSEAIARKEENISMQESNRRAKISQRDILLQNHNRFYNKQKDAAEIDRILTRQREMQREMEKIKKEKISLEYMAKKLKTRTTIYIKAFGTFTADFYRYLLHTSIDKARYVEITNALEKLADKLDDIGFTKNEKHRTRKHRRNKGRIARRKKRLKCRQKESKHNA